MYLYFLFLFYNQLTPQQLGSDYELLVKNQLSTERGFLTQLVATKRYNYTDQKCEYFGDGGVDIIVVYYDMDVLIQCKNLSGKVGSSIVREMAGIKKDKVGCIVSKNGFSSTAITIANHNNIILTNEKNVASDLLNYYNTKFKKNNSNVIEYSVEHIDFIKYDKIEMNGLKNCVIKIYK